MLIIIKAKEVIPLAKNILEISLVAVIADDTLVCLSDSERD